MSDENVVELRERDWESKVEKSGTPVVVMFHSPTCGHCREIEPFFREFAREFEGKVLFGRLNITESPYLAERYGVMGTPTFKFFCSGRPVQELVGATYPAILKKTIEETMERGPECIKRSTKIDYTMTGYA